VKAFLLVLRFSGLRTSDVTTLKCESPQGNRLSLHQSKTAEQVFVPLPKWVADFLRSIPHGHPKYFFWTGYSKLPGAVSVWRKRLAAVFKAARIPDAHSHRFRDTFAVSPLQSGASLKDVSILLGHQCLKITEKHYPPWVKSRQEALDLEIRKTITRAGTGA
jgi:integrase